MSLLKGDFVYRDNLGLTVFSSGGSTLHTNRGDYIDLQASSGANILGYDDSLMMETLELDTYLNAKPQLMESNTRIQFAKKLSDLIEKQTDRKGKIGFEISGGGAIELAIKVAVLKDKKKRPIIISLESCYHGRTHYLSHLTSTKKYITQELNFDRLIISNPFRVANELSIEISEAEGLCVDQFISSLYAFSAEQNDLLPILIYETVQNVGGGIDLPATFLNRIESIIKKHNGVSIVDEIFTGLFRISKFLDHPRKNLNPDIVVLSKGLTNGVLPISCIWVSETSRLEGTFLPGTHSSTYINSDFTFAFAGIVLDRLHKVIDIPGEKSLFSRISENIFTDFEKSVFSNYVAINLPSHVCSSMVRERLHKPEYGVITAFTSQSENRLLMHPAYTINESEIERSLECVKRAIYA